MCSRQRIRNLSLAKAALSEEGIDIHTNTPLDALSGKQLQAEFAGQTKQFDAYIMSVVLGEC